MASNAMSGRLAARPGDSESLKGLGTYGVIRRPAGFLLGSASDLNEGLVDFGYAMQGVILLATDLGLGTCWIGWFKEEIAKKALGVPESMRVVAFSPLGYPAGPPGALERRPLDQIMSRNQYEVR